MKSFHITMLIGLAVYCLIASTPVSAKEAIDIMDAVDRVARESYSSSVVKMKLSTCRYAVKQGSMICTETPRVSVLEVGEKKYGPNNRDTRSVAVVLEPVMDKGIGMLTYDYGVDGKDNDVWLYLTALGKVKRLISGEDSDESGSYFGSEFAVDDMIIRKVKDYTYRILGEETYSDRSVWVIESVPTLERAKKTKYGKLICWIDKERHIILKENLFDRTGKLYKQKLMKDIEQTDNVWVVRKTTINNLVSRRASNLELTSVAYNKKVSDELLTQRSLTDFAFREKNLSELRTYMK